MTYCHLLATTAGSRETRLKDLEYVAQSVSAILYFRFVKGSTIFHVTDTSERTFYYHDWRYCFIETVARTTFVLTTSYANTRGGWE